VEKDMEKRLQATAEHMRKIASKPTTIFEEEEGEASGAAAKTLARWASQIPPSENLAIPSSLKDSSVPPPPPSKSKGERAPPSSLSSSLSSSSEGGRHQRGWTKGPKGKKGKKYFFKVKAPYVKERPCQQDATKPREYSADKSKDL
jgi:hypothetical protein